MTGLLGGDDQIQFEPWRMVTDPAGNCYYIFFQMYADTTVSGGAVKIITDADGNMLGMTCSMETELPEVEAAEGISAEQAEEIVREHAEENGEMLPEILEGPDETISEQ
jgi:Zn-dependent metalloprotease